MITKKIHRNLEKPPRSWLRKMSENTRSSSEIQMKNIVNQMKDQKTWPVPNSEPSMCVAFRFLLLAPRLLPGRPIVARTSTEKTRVRHPRRCARSPYGTRPLVGAVGAVRRHCDRDVATPIDGGSAS